MAANLLRNDSSFVQMMILTDDHKKASLTQAEAYGVEEYIFDQIFVISGKRSHFKGPYVFSNDDGAIIINTHVDSVSWLKKVVGSYKGKVLRITDIKNSPQYTAIVKVDVSRLAGKVLDNLFDLLETHNYGLQTDGWRVSSITREVSPDYPFTLRPISITFLIDDPGWEMLEKNGFKLFAGYSTLTFNPLGRVKRSETTGIICKDDV